MLVRNILGEELWEADSDDEARELWRDYPEDREKIWFRDEITMCILYTPEGLQECLLQKKSKPGRLTL